MINIEQNYRPFWAIRNPALNTYEIDELVKEYLLQESKPSFYQGQIVPAVHLTNFAARHSQKLSKYLNRHLEHNYHFEVKNGYFADYNLIEHWWIQSDNLLLDLTIRQFLNYPQIDQAIQQQLSDYSYYLSDDPEHFLYRLYFEDL